MRKAILVVCIALCCVTLRGNAADSASYGPVRANENLYRIALEHQQPGTTASQWMMAIYYANPDAFTGNNINRLKLGSTLDIPPAETVAALDPREAYREASEHIATFEKEKRAERNAAIASDSGSSGSAAAATVVAAETVIEPDLNEIAEIKQGLAADQSAQAGALPEPKPAKKQKKQKEGPPPIRFSYELAYIDDDNIRLAQEEEDIRSDQILSAALRAKGGKSLDSHTIFNYGASATLNKHDTFDTLDNYEIEANVRYRFALSSGFTSPIYTLGARIGGQEFDTEMRDATFVQLSADLNKWITNTINMTTGLDFNKRDSKSEVFDTEDARIFLNFDTNFTNRDLVYTTFTYITGDTVSSSTPSLGIIEVADAIEPDDAFGGVEANQFAYRIDSNTVVFTLGYNRIMSRNVSLDFSARYVESEAKDDSDIMYDRTILRASLLGRF